MDDGGGGRTGTRDRRRLGVGAAVVLVLLALAVTVTIGIVRTALAPVERVPSDAGRSIPASPVADAVEPALAAVYVHVSGAVAAPGLYRLDQGDRVVDAVAAAGGFAETADPAGVNLARVVSDGEQLHVPRVGEAPAPAGPGAAEAPGGASLVNLNTADVVALDTLPRIGPALAQRIVDWREENGRFTSVDDLLAVTGIGERLLDGMRDLVTL